MKTLELTKDKVAVVDDDVYEWASKFKWHAAEQRNQRFYAARWIRQAGRRKLLFLHSDIMKPGEALEVDHRDGDGLNNLRENLRIATKSQNRWAFRRPKENSDSSFRGVSWNKKTRKWLAKIKHAGKPIHLGLFQSEEAAAQAFDTAAKQYRGDFAQINFS